MVHSNMVRIIASAIVIDNLFFRKKIYDRMIEKRRYF